MKQLIIAALAIVLYGNAKADTTYESTVKDTSSHLETITEVKQDGAETYTYTITKSKDASSEVNISGDTYHEANSGDKYYHEICVGSDGYRSEFEEKYSHESDVKNSPDMYTSHYAEGYMKNSSEFNPNTMIDKGQFEASHYIENVSDGGGTYKEDIYGDAIWKSYYKDPGYSEKIYGESTWDSDVTISANYYESNLATSNVYEETVVEGNYESDLFKSDHYKEKVVENGDNYSEDIYGEAVWKSKVINGSYQEAIYGEAVWDSDTHITPNSKEVNIYKSDAYMEIVSDEGYSSTFSDQNEHIENVAFSY
jgi:hypothetical protein